MRACQTEALTDGLCLVRRDVAMCEFFVKHGVAPQAYVLVEHMQGLGGCGHAFTDHDSVVEFENLFFTKERATTMSANDSFCFSGHWVLNLLHIHVARAVCP